MNFKIIGTGSYVPDKIVTNDDLSTLVETSDEWISKRVGIRERRVSETETALDMGTKAALEALNDAGCTGADIDLIIAATISNETVCPSLACMLQKKIGAGCLAFDVNAACSGFLFAIETAMGYLNRGTVKKALIVCAERMSKLIDWNDRGTCVIFGDGAAAAVLSATEEGLYDSVFTVKGDDVVLKIPSASGMSPFFKKENLPPYLIMNGQETFKFAVNSIASNIEQLLEKTGLNENDIAHVIPHQANKRIIDFAQKKTGFNAEKWYVNIDRFGNISSASIPIALDEMNKKGMLRHGEKILLCAFGGGLASGALIFEW